VERGAGKAKRGKSEEERVKKKIKKLKILRRLRSDSLISFVYKGD
jgi:hypothetical protein